MGLPGENYYRAVGMMGRRTSGGDQGIGYVPEGPEDHWENGGDPLLAGGGLQKYHTEVPPLG